MALKDTIKHLRELLTNISHDLEKADSSGNKAASQRVRTGTVKLEKIAKLYRKESIKTEKGSSKAPKKAASKKPAASKKAKPAAAKAKTSSVKAKGKAKAHRAHPRALSFKKPSAKLPSKRAFAF